MIPSIIAFSLFFIFIFILIVITVIICLLKMGKKRITSQGMTLYIDRNIFDKVDFIQINKYINIFIAHMTPVPFDSTNLVNHIKEISCNLRSQKLTTEARAADGKKILYNGLTLSSEEIEIACDKYCWVDGKVDITKTAFGYELLNACIEELVKDGYYIALAEGFIDPTKQTYWGWFSDVTGDKIINEEDVKKWKELRKPYDEAFKRVQFAANESL